MIIDITGNPGGNANVIAPAQITALDIAKPYLVANNTTGGHTIIFKTLSGTGVTVPVGEAYWCYGDGTNIIAAGVELAGTATTATTATDSTQLGGVVAANYALVGTQQSYTAGQSTVRFVPTESGGTVPINIA
jgi:hypothetical protein